MEIVYLNPSGQLGGAERSLLDFMASLRTANPRCTLRLIAGADGALLSEARAIGVSSSVLPFPPPLARLGDSGAGGPAGGGQANLLGTLGRMSLSTPSIALYTARLRRRLRETAPDLIHTNGFKMHLLGALAAPRGVPLIWHVHDYVRTRPVMRRLLRAYRDRCAAIITNSLSVADDVRAACGPQLRVFPIYNAVNLERFAPAGPKLDLDRLAGMPPPSAPIIRVGMVATMARWKGHKVFLQALKILANDLPVRAYVIGSAVYQTDRSQYDTNELRRAAGRLGLDDRVGFTGFVNDVPAAMRALDIVVHASIKPEPFGLVIAEAMACGRALVVSRAGGAAEIISPGEDALAHEPGCAVMLAERIDELVRNPALRAALGRNAAQAARRRFAPARLAAELQPVYQLFSKVAA